MNKFTFAIAFAALIVQPAFAGTLVFEAEEEEEIIIVESSSSSASTKAPTGSIIRAKVNTAPTTDGGIRCTLADGQVVILSGEECAKHQEQ